MVLTIEGSHCANCGKKLENDWYFCSKCGTSRQNYLTQCDRCYHIITEVDAIYCPYCKNKLQKTYEKSVYTVNSMKEEVSIDQIREKPLTASILIENLKFNPNAVKQILYSKRFTYIALLSILLMSITGAYSNYLVTRYNYYGASPSVGFNVLTFGSFFNSVVITFATIFVFGYSFNVLLEFMHIKHEGMNFIRIVGSYLPIFLLKDIILIILGTMVGTSSIPSGLYFSIVNINELLFLLVIIFVFFHMLFTTIKSTQLGVFMTILAIFSSFILSAIIGFNLLNIMLNSTYIQYF